MNKRIRELAEQSGISRQYQEEYFGPKLLEQFAELIVAECMMLCGAVSGAAQVVRPNDAFGNGAEKCKALIKEHFGVQE